MHCRNSLEIVDAPLFHRHSQTVLIRRYTIRLVILNYIDLFGQFDCVASSSFVGETLRGNQLCASMLIWPRIDCCRCHRRHLSRFPKCLQKIDCLFSRSIWHTQNVVVLIAQCLNGRKVLASSTDIMMLHHPSTNSNRAESFAFLSHINCYTMHLILVVSSAACLLYQGKGQSSSSSVRLSNDGRLN